MHSHQVRGMSGYDWDGEDYEKYSQAQQKWARELMENLSFRGDETVLDLGCGDGKVSAEIARLLPRGRLLGIDSAPSMIALARKRFPLTGHPNLSFELMDASALSFAEQFDLVFSNAALHWIKDHAPVVQGIQASLKPGGRILLQMGGEGNARDMVNILEELSSAPCWRKYFADFSFPYGFYSPAAYRLLLSDCGFLIDRVELIEKDMEHDGELGLAGWIRTTWLPYTQRLPDQIRDEFIDLIVTRYLDKIPLDAAGKAHVAMVRLEVAAEKPTFFEKQC